MKETLLVIGLFVLVMALSVALSIGWEKAECQQFTAMHSDDFEFQWVLYGGCMVKTAGGRWVDADQYLQLEVSQ